MLVCVRDAWSFCYPFPHGVTSVVRLLRPRNSPNKVTWLNSTRGCSFQQAILERRTNFNSYLACVTEARKLGGLTICAIFSRVLLEHSLRNSETFRDGVFWKSDVSFGDLFTISVATSFAAFRGALRFLWMCG